MKEKCRMGTRRKDLQAPCKGCTERKTACHDSCQRYAQWQEMRKAMKKNLSETRYDRVVKTALWKRKKR